jgi:4-carboxymuconolactone decarboxylase
MIVVPGDRAPWHWIAPMIEDALSGVPHRCDQAFKGWSQHFMTIGDAARAAIELSEAPAQNIRTRCYTVLGIPRPVFAEELAAALVDRFPGFSVEFSRGARPEKTRRFDDRYAREEWGWRPDAATVDAVIEDFKLRMNSMYARNVLDSGTRELCAVAALTALGAHDELRLHIRMALRSNRKAAHVREAILQMAVYAGMPAALAGARIFDKVMEEPEFKKRSLRT